MFGKNKEKNKVDILLKEIRTDYETLVMHFSKSGSLGKQFEMRYRDAVEYRMNLLRFLGAEREAVKSMLGQAEDQQNADIVKVKAEKSPVALQGKSGKNATATIDNDKERVSYADRLIKEFAERIEKYPEIIIHPDAAFEMKKLFGALLCLEKDYWGFIDRVLRHTSGSKRFRESIDLEPEINRMCTVGTDGLPSALGTYYRLLERMPRNYRDVEQEEKRCLVNAAGLLKRMQMEIIRTMDISGGVLEAEDKHRLTEAKVYIDGMIDDFRLKDLAKLN